jgi:hypothetical protein
MGLWHGYSLTSDSAKKKYTLTAKRIDTIVLAILGNK